jgi:hypothetical protein
MTYELFPIEEVSLIAMTIVTIKETHNNETNHQTTTKKGFYIT